MKTRSKLTIFLCLLLCMTLIVSVIPQQTSKAAEQNDGNTTVTTVGDIDGDGNINAKDVTMLRRFLAGGWGVTVNEEDADIDGDGNVNAKDVTMLRRYLAGGWGVTLPEKTVSVKDVIIDENSFPDEVFRAYVQEKLDTDKNGILSEQEIRDVKKIQTNYNSGIKSMKGIELFINLESLTCSFNEITELDVSKNKALTFLNCGQNYIQKLDLSKNTKLETLYCWGNQMTELDLSANTKLERLDISDNNITKIDLKNNKKLYYLYCPYTEITDLDLSVNSKLTRLVCDDGVSLIRKVEITDKVFEDDIFRTFVLEYDTDKDGYLSNEEIEAVKDLDVSETNIESLNGIEVFRHLDSLNCSNTLINSLTFGNEEEPVISIDTIDARYNPNLKDLNCWAMGVKTLKLGGDNIDEVLCGCNEIEELDVSSCPKLNRLDCSYNKLTKLDVSACVNLTILSCTRNKISVLDLSSNSKLIKENVWVDSGVEVTWYVSDPNGQEIIPDDSDAPKFDDKGRLIWEVSSSEVHFYTTNPRMREAWTRPAQTEKKYTYDEQYHIVKIECTNTETDETMIASFEYENNLQTKTEWKYSDGSVLTWVFKYDEMNLLSEMTYNDSYGNNVEYFMGSGSIDSLEIDEATIVDIQHYGPYGTWEIPWGINGGYVLSPMLNFDGYLIKYTYSTDSNKLILITIEDTGSDKVFTAVYEYGDIYMSKAVYTFPDGLVRVSEFDQDGILVNEDQFYN